MAGPTGGFRRSRDGLQMRAWPLLLVFRLVPSSAAMCRRPAPAQPQLFPPSPLPAALTSTTPGWHPRDPRASATVRAGSFSDAARAAESRLSSPGRQPRIAPTPLSLAFIANLPALDQPHRPRPFSRRLPGTRTAQGAQTPRNAPQPRTWLCWLSWSLTLLPLHLARNPSAFPVKGSQRGFRDTRRSR